MWITIMALLQKESQIKNEVLDNTSCFKEHVADGKVGGPEDRVVLPRCVGGNLTCMEVRPLTSTPSLPHLPHTLQ